MDSGLDSWIRGQGLHKLSTTARTSVPVATAPTGVLGASWGLDGRIVFGSTTGGLHRVSADGGAIEELTSVDAASGERSHAWPFIIPGRNAELLVVSSGMPITTGELAVLSFDDGSIRRLGIPGLGPRYVPTGHLVYATADGTILAAPFDATSLTVTGSPVPVLDGVAMWETGAVHLDISANGHLVYGTVGSGARRTLVWVDRNGREEPLGVPSRAYRDVAVSHDGNRVWSGVLHAGRNTGSVRGTFGPRQTEPRCHSTERKRRAGGASRHGVQLATARTVSRRSVGRLYVERFRADRSLREALSSRRVRPLVNLTGWRGGSPLVIRWPRAVLHSGRPKAAR